MLAACAPDFVTDSGTYCHAWVRPPAKVGLPLRPDAEVSITTKRGPLRPLGGYCREHWRGQRIVALVERCGSALRVSLWARGPVPRAEVSAVGAPLAFP